MEFGLFLNTQLYESTETPQARMEALVSQVERAEACGFTLVMAGQHFLAHPYRMFAPMPLLATLSAVTDTMRLATGVLLAPHVNPVALAEETATLDQLSCGRLILGLGLGYREVEFSAFGVQRAERVSRMSDHVGALKGLLEGRVVEVDGRRVDGSHVSMAPLQRPRPPVWIGADAEPSIRRAAALGDAWFIGPGTNLERLETKMTWYRDALRAIGRPHTPPPVMREAVVGASRREAIATAGSHLMRKYQNNRAWRDGSGSGRVRAQVAEFGIGRFVMGDTNDCVEEIAALHAVTGTDCVVFRVEWPGSSSQHALDTIEALGSEVLPRVRELFR